MQRGLGFHFMDHLGTKVLKISGHPENVERAKRTFSEITSGIVIDLNVS